MKSIFFVKVKGKKEIEYMMKRKDDMSNRILIVIEAIQKYSTM